LTTGTDNTAIGFNALSSNTTGSDNTATGWGALQNNIDINCTADGAGALSFNTTANDNTAAGASALQLNTTGFNNVATGSHALVINSTGSGNTAVGHDALLFNRKGNNNIALGDTAGSVITGHNNIDTGNGGVTGESSTIRIGTAGTHRAAVIAGIVDATLAGGAPVIINREGRLGVSTSSKRFKDDIKPMDQASEAILALKPGDLPLQARS